MGNVRAPLDEATLRETRDVLIKDVQDQRREIGVPVPDEKTAAEFVDPILRRVETEHERDRAKDLVRPETKPTIAPKTDEVQVADDGSRWWGEPGHSMQLGPGQTPYCRNVGEVTVNPNTGQAHFVPYQTAAGQQGLKRAVAIDAAVNRVRWLCQNFPEWKAKFHAVLNANQPKAWQEKRYRALLAESVRLFGDPRGVSP